MINNSSPLDLVFLALSDRNRRAMIEMLSAGPLSVSHLAEPLNISLPAVMQHLAVLEACELVVSVKKGRVRTCALSSEAIARAESWLSARRNMVVQRLDRLEQFLDSKSETPK